MACWRKLFIRTAASLGVNEWNARMMDCKAVSKDILTYVNCVNLAKDFLKISNFLRLKAETKNAKNVETLEKPVQV